jgi:integrase
MPVHYDARNRRWRFQFNRIVAGRRRRTSKLLPAAWGRAEAEAFARQEEGRLYAVATGLEPSRYLIDDALRVWLEEKAPKLRDGKKAAQSIAHVLPHLSGRTLDQAPEAFTAYSAAAEVSEVTVKNRLAWVRAALRYAYKRHRMGTREIIDALPVPAADNVRTVHASQAELERLWRAIDDDEARAINRLAFYTGLRWRAELHPRKPEDIRRAGRDVWLMVGMTKNGLPRMAYVPPEARADLKALPFRQTTRALYAAFERARARAGLGHLWMHDYRRSLASLVVNTGGTPHELQAVLHHESMGALRRYAFLYPQAAQAAVRRALKMPTRQKKKVA